MKLETARIPLGYAKLYLDPTTWVVWATQLLRLISLSFVDFLITHSGRTCAPIWTICTSYDVFPRKGVPLLEGGTLILLPI